MTATPDSTLAKSEAARVYRPDSRFGVGVGVAVKALARELVAHRSHIQTMFMGRFRAAYQGTGLGAFWNFVLPLVPITVYVFLAYMRVFPRLEGIAPAVYICFSATIWYLFVGMVKEPIKIVFSRNATAMKTALPLSTSIASSFAQLLFETLIRVVLVIVLVAWFRQWPVLTAPLAALAVVPGLAFCFGLGLCLAIYNAVYPDVERVATIALQYGIFLSGVIFPLASIPQLEQLGWLNPFYIFIATARDLVFSGTLSHPVAYAVWSVIGIVLLFVGARFFYVMEYRLRTLV